MSGLVLFVLWLCPSPKIVLYMLYVFVCCMYQVCVHHWYTSMEAHTVHACCIYIHIHRCACILCSCGHITKNMKILSYRPKWYSGATLPSSIFPSARWRRNSLWGAVGLHYWFKIKSLLEIIWYLTAGMLSLQMKNFWFPASLSPIRTQYLKGSRTDADSVAPSAAKLQPQLCEGSKIRYSTVPGIKIVVK